MKEQIRKKIREKLNESAVESKPDNISQEIYDQIIKFVEQIRNVNSGVKLKFKNDIAIVTVGYNVIVIKCDSGGMADLKTISSKLFKK